MNLASIANTNETQASSSTSSQVLATNISKITHGNCKTVISQMTNELYNLHITVNSMNKESVRLNK